MEKKDWNPKSYLTLGNAVKVLGLIAGGIVIFGSAFGLISSVKVAHDLNAQPEPAPDPQTAQDDYSRWGVGA